MNGQILLVENDPMIVQVARDLLRFDGHTVISANDGIEGLQLFSAGQFDVVITDVKMPKMNGIELLKSVKSADPTVEVIVLTGFGTVELAIDVIRFGGYDFLQKPDDVTRRLRTTVTHALERRELSIKNQDLVDSLEEQVVDKTNEARRLAAQYQVTSILTETDTLTEAAPLILDVLLKNLGWKYGAIWRAERFTDELKCLDIQTDVDDPNDTFPKNTRIKNYSIGHGVPGRVWADKKHMLVADGEELPCLGFPILHGDRIVGVLTFYHSEIPEPGENLVRMMTSICSQIGLFIEKEQLEQQFRQSQKLEAIGRLAGGIAHDFNNLLTSIMGYAHLIERHVSEHETLHRNARQIQKTGHRAASLIQQLLTLSRSQVMKPELTDINQVIQDIQPMIDRLLTDHIECRTELMAKSDMVLADHTQLEQVIVNLAVNARDAMESGGTLSIETRLVRLDDHDARIRDLKPGNHILISVSDTGEGMDDTVKAHLFEPFFTTKDKGKGSGLGLATVYGIVTQSNGHIDVASAPGEGTTFSIYLPVAVNAAESKVTEDRVDAGAPNASDVGTETILIVENETDIREIMRSILEEAGYVIHEAENGVDALECLEGKSDEVHLVISDLFMPKMMGNTFIEKLLRTYPTVKILLISGTMEESKVSETMILNEFPFLPKPFTPEDLLKQVRSALDMPQFNLPDSFKQ